LLKEFFPNATVSPPDKTAMSVAPMTIIRRKITPRGASSQNPKDSIDELPVIFGNPSPYSCSPWKMRFYELPNMI